MSYIDKHFNNDTICAIGPTNGTIGDIDSTNITIVANGTVDSTNGTIGSRKTFPILWSPLVSLATKSANCRNDIVGIGRTPNTAHV